MYLQIILSSCVIAIQWHAHIGIEKCKWPGRQQVVYRDHVTYYLDGAHTNKSAEACSDWFKSAAYEEAMKSQ